MQAEVLQIVKIIHHNFCVKCELRPESTLYSGFCANGMKIEFEKVILTIHF